jgi:hypothetical protein
MTDASVPPNLQPHKDRPVTIDDIKRKLREYYVLKDEGIVDVVLATFIANKLSTVDAPVWLLLVAESSGGKTEIIDMFSDLQDDKYKLSYSISDLSTNTFISGMQNNTNETSLLHKINGRIIFIKDFTTILTKNKEEMKTLLGQFREIYDGEVNKDFGTGKSVHWKGRVGVIAGLTPPAVEVMARQGGMGERFIAYYINQPSDEELSQAMKDSYTKDVRKIKTQLRAMVAQYVEAHVLMAETADFDMQSLSDEILNDLNEVGQFATRARSTMLTDIRSGDPISLPSIERFPRFTKELQSIAKAFCLMNGRVALTEGQKRILYKIALDSIPRTRRSVLRLLTQYKSVTTGAAAARFGFDTQFMKGQLGQLAVLKFVAKFKNGNEYTWRLFNKHKEFMKRFDGVQLSDDDLLDEDDTSPLDDDEEIKDEVTAAQVDADNAVRQSAIAQLMKDNPSWSWETAENEYKKIEEGNRQFDEW